MDGLQAVTAVTISGACVVGMVLALLGSIKLTLARHLQVGEAKIGSLLAGFNLALIPMMVLIGFIIDSLGIAVVLILGSLITSAAIFSLSLAYTYQRAFLSLLFTGLGLAAVSTATVLLMPLAFFPADAGPQEAAALNLGFVFIALGALATPVLVDILLRLLAYRRTLLILAFLSLIPAFLCIVPEFSKRLTDAAVSADRGLETVPLWDNPAAWHLLLAGLVFLFYAPVEAAVGVWSTTLLTEAGYSEKRSALLLSGFWGSFLASRLLVAFLHLPPQWDPWLITIPPILAAVVLGNVSASVGKFPARNGLLMVGFLLGPVFPTLLGMLFREFSMQRGTVYGLVFALGSFGSMLMAPLIGVRVGKNNAHIAMRSSMWLALVLGVMATVFVLIAGPGALSGRP